MDEENQLTKTVLHSMLSASPNAFTLNSDSKKLAFWLGNNHVSHVISPVPVVLHEIMVEQLRLHVSLTKAKGFCVTRVRKLYSIMESEKNLSTPIDIESLTTTQLALNVTLIGSASVNISFS